MSGERRSRYTGSAAFRQAKMASGSVETSCVGKADPMKTSGEQTRPRLARVGH